MNVSNKVINELNKDEKAIELKRKFDKSLLKYGKDLTAKEVEDAHIYIMMLIIRQNKNAMKVMANEVYQELRKD